jgi:hypothetical protein
MPAISFSSLQGSTSWSKFLGDLAVFHFHHGPPFIVVKQWLDAYITAEGNVS